MKRLFFNIAAVLLAAGLSAPRRRPAIPRAASDWVTAQGRLVGDMFYEAYGRPRPWLVDDDTELIAIARRRPGSAMAAAC